MPKNNLPIVQLGWILPFFILLSMPILEKGKFIEVVEALPLPTETTEVEVDSEVTGTVELPDWNQISLSELNTIESNGNGYDGRSWQAGSSPDEFLKLGDLEQSFAPQKMTVGETASKGDKDLDKIPLSDFPLVLNQSLSHLLNIVPGLAEKLPAGVPSIWALLKQKGENIIDKSLAEIVADKPDLGAIKLSELPENKLQQFTVNSIPGLAKVKLADFDNWQDSFVNNIPGLSTIPLASMPHPITLSGTNVARIDAVWGINETKRYKTVSGGYNEGFSVPCETNCAYIELDDLENSGRSIRGDFEGSQWINGLAQDVDGGWGCLKWVNGGREPTGRHPYGPGFKVVVTQTDETTDNVETSMYFQWCNICGCTPYYIGPVPFQSYHVND